MKEAQKSFLWKLLSTPSPTGFETLGQKVWMEGMAEMADSVERDSYGNAWAMLNGAAGDAALKVMIESHADEIGFMINFIDEKGFLSVIPVGGSDPAIVRGKRVVFSGDKGDVVGVFANTAIHLRKDTTGTESIPKWHEIFVDIGAASREEVLKRGLRVGCVGVFEESPFELSEGRLTGRAIDNRISGYLLYRIFRELAADRNACQATVYGVNSVQEEVGGNGATMVANRLYPDLALVFDVTHATDYPGVQQTRFGEIKLGAGPTLTHGTANHPRIVQRLMELCEEHGIPCQHEAISRTSGTDTDNIFVTRSGIPSALVSIPLRYMHSPVETVDMRDVEYTVQLIVSFLKSLKAEDRF